MSARGCVVSLSGILALSGLAFILVSLVWDWSGHETGRLSEAAAELRSVYGEIDPALAERLVAGQGVLPEDSLHVLRSYRPQINRIIRATRLPAADWGIDYEKVEWGTPLRHLGELRVLARLLQAEASRAVMDWDTTRAADVIEVLFRLSRHTGSENSAEGIAATGIRTIATDAMLAHWGSWSEFQRRRLVEVMRGIDAGDPISTSATHDERCFQGWVDMSEEDAQEMRAKLGIIIEVYESTVNRR